MMYPSEKEANDDQKHYLCMPDHTCSHFCRTKYPGGGVSVSGMDDLDVEGTNADWNFGDRIYRRLAIEIPET